MPEALSLTVRHPVPAAVVLDFDGVVANSEPLHLAAFQQVLAEVGIALSAQDYYDRYLGYTDAEVIDAVAADWGLTLPPGEARRLFDCKAGILERLLADPRVLFPGAAEWVRTHAATLPLAIASGARREEIERVLMLSGLRSCFAAIVAAGETARAKPAPDPYERAMALLVEAGVVSSDVPRERCVAVEDSRWGIESARAAGLTCVGVTTSYPAEALGDADAVASSLASVTLDFLTRVLSEGGRR